MALIGSQFEYSGDDGNLIMSWLTKQVRAIGLCFDSGLPEAALTLLYSGIDTLGFLAASPPKNKATEETFKDWCNVYLLTRLKSVDGETLTSLDLYAARCGILHTSSPVSNRSRKGAAREVCYQFKGQHGVNLMMNVKLVPLMLDIEEFITAFKESGIAFIQDLSRDQTRREAAEMRASSFFRWGTLTAAESH
jgi:hypothetical protein